MRFSKFAADAAVAALCLLPAQAALAQGLTGKTVHIIVPYTAGGAGAVCGLDRQPVRGQHQLQSRHQQPDRLRSRAPRRDVDH